MKPIDILGLKNFRVFDNETGFFEEMSAINVLTGANSSGKSSVIKALQMIKNSIRGDFPFELDLTQQEHLLGDFENVLNSKDNRELSISLPFTFMGLTNFFITLGFVVQPEDTYKAKLRKIEVTDTFDKSNLFLFYYREASESEIKEDAEEYQRQREEAEQQRKALSKADGGVFSSNSRFFDPFENPLTGYVEWKINSEKLKIYLNDLLEVYRFYEKNGKNSQWMERADKLYDDRDFPFVASTFIKSFKNDVDTKAWSDFIGNVLAGGEISGKVKLGERDFEPDDIFFPVPQIEDNLYYKSLQILRTKLKWKADDGEDSYYNIIENSFKNSWEGLSQRVLSINNLSSIREQNSRIYHAGDNSAFITLLKDYSGQQHNRNSFVNRYLRSFQIGKKLVVEYRPDYQLLFVSVETIEGGKRELVDFGYGIKQLILILVQISVLAQRNERMKHEQHSDGEEIIRDVYDPSMLLIEEPETNLHPKWQSVLAEMFVEANKKYNIQFLIETHSEYMIRKLQTMVAEKDVDADRINLFYLREKRLAIAGKKQVERVEIQEDGSIDYKVFDGGFFDESDTLELSLLNVKRKNFIEEFQALKAAKTAGDEEISDLAEQIDRYLEMFNVDGYRQVIEQQFDTAKLSATTVEYLVSAQYLLGTANTATDCSPIIFQYGRAIENELKRIFSKIPHGRDPWTFGLMQGYLEKFKNGTTVIRARYVAGRQSLLLTELQSFFNDPVQLKIELINDLRLTRNSAGHGELTKDLQQAKDYILKASEFLNEWILQKKI